MVSTCHDFNCLLSRLISGSTSRSAPTLGSRSGTISGRREPSRAEFKNGAEKKKQCIDLQKQRVSGIIQSPICFDRARLNGLGELTLMRL